MSTRATLCLVTGVLVAAIPSTAAAQSGEPLRLSVLQQEARAADARMRELELLASQTDLRLHNLDAERLPAVSTLAQTQYQSDVATLPLVLPGGQPSLAPPKFTYDVSIRGDEKLYDPSRAARGDLARADLAESQARVRTALFALRQEVNDAFFTAAILQEQIGALTASIGDLEARLRETAARVREGTALAGEAAAVEAALLRQRQQAD